MFDWFLKEGHILTSNLSPGHHLLFLSKYFDYSTRHEIMVLADGPLNKLCARFEVENACDADASMSIYYSLLYLKEFFETIFEGLTGSECKFLIQDHGAFSRLQTLLATMETGSDDADQVSHQLFFGTFALWVNYFAVALI